MTITVFWEGEKKNSLSIVFKNGQVFVVFTWFNNYFGKYCFSSSKLDHPSSAQTYLQVIKGGGNRETDEQNTTNDW